jgi:4-carboxymuconolactone decarboxylase
MTNGKRTALVTESQTAEMSELLARVAKARGGRVPNLYRALALSPGICRAWLELFTQLRQHSVVPVLLRELAMLRIAVLNRAEYEFSAHLPYAREAGATDPQLAALRDAALNAQVFDEAQLAVLRYADAMTLHVQVDDATFNALSKFLDAKAVLEVTVIVAGYNMVSRVLEALAIPHDA